jgi:hypothetical protein
MGRHKKTSDLKKEPDNELDNELDKEPDKEPDENSKNITELKPLLDIQKEAEGSEKKSKYKEKKEKEKIKFKFIAKFPIIIINFLFLKFKVSELDNDEEKDLSEAFEGMVMLFPEKWLKYLEKLSPVVFFVYIVSIIVNKRRKELIELNKKKPVNNGFKDDDELVDKFKND